MSEKVYEGNSRGIWPFSCRYIVYSDRIRIQSPLRFYWFEIPYDDIVKVELRNPPVVWDAYKQSILFTRKYFFRIYKNDLADLFKHISIEKRNGFWRQIRIAPKDPEKFYDVLQHAIKKRRKK
ncbi:MAG: hypothetical protein DRN95_08440 [Candidatus Hydrothermarchaeota archaeon]|nr:MAG: hypothetical protein DRN95_08440 [Candidatus Hydrothermarchaeota archaeon]